MRFDHVLLVGFGGPSRPEDVEPFLAHVTRGLRIPAERLAQVRQNYARIGGASPYNAHAARLAERLAARLREDGHVLPVFVGLRNWHPFLSEVLGPIARSGRRRGVGVILAPHRSPTSFEQYQHNVDEARARASAGGVTYDYVGPWHDHPLFIQAQAEEAARVLDAVPAGERADVHLLCSAHAIPVAMAQRCRYVEEVETSCRLVAQRLQHPRWSVAYQSRSGRPEEPWLEPDVYAAIRGLRARGASRVLLVPIGFLFDHTEVLYDLDVAAREEAERAGLAYLRAPTVMDHPQTPALFSRLIQARLRGSAPAAGRHVPA